MTIPFFYSLLAVLNFCFGIVLLLLSILKTKRDLLYLVPVFLLRIIYLIPPAIVIYNIDITWSVWTTGPVRVTIVPLMFLYIKKKFDSNKSIQKADLLHFIPTLIDLLITIPIAALHANEVINHGGFNMKEAMQTIWDGNTYYSILAITGRAIIFLQCIFYFFKLIPIIRKCINYQKSQFSFQNIEYIKWTKILVYVFIVWGIFDGVAIFGAYSIPAILIPMSIIRVIISFYTFIYAILYLDEQSLMIPSAIDIEELNEQKNETDEDWIISFCKLELFLDVNLSLQKTSEMLNIPKYKLTQLIKDAGYDSFYSFVNHFRIKKSKELLLAKPENYVIESIIEQSGFKSRSTFFRVFKEMTHETPGVFIKKNA